MNVQKLSILGYCQGNTPIVSEMCAEVLKIHEFDLIKNVEIDSRELVETMQAFHFNIFQSDEYDYQSDEKKFYFGVLDAHIKYILYQFFFINMVFLKNDLLI